MTRSSGAEAIARLDSFSQATHDIRNIGTRHNELLYWCRNNWQRLVLPDLFAEIFDIPKSEEDEASASGYSGPTTSQQN